jgi:hypothetical protein
MILNNVQGVFSTYFWRGSCWIVYEVLTGHYLEAFRDLRFMFEGSLLALAYDWLINSITLEEAGSYVGLDVKAELRELCRGAKRKGKTIRRSRI